MSLSNEPREQGRERAVPALREALQGRQSQGCRGEGVQQGAQHVEPLSTAGELAAGQRGPPSLPAARYHRGRPPRSPAPEKCLEEGVPAYGRGVETGSLRSLPSHDSRKNLARAEAVGGRCEAHGLAAGGVTRQ